MIAAEAISKKGITRGIVPSRDCTALDGCHNVTANRDDLYKFFKQGDSSRWCTAGVVCEFEFPSRYYKYAVPFPHYSVDGFYILCVT